MSNYQNLSDEKKEARRRASRAWSSRNKSKTATMLRKWQRERMVWFQSLKIGKFCQDCGEDDIICLDYHHLDPKTKEGLPQKIARSTSDNKKVMAEIEKCILICANCHRKRHRFGHEVV